jgi:hypothetical protein
MPARERTRGLVRNLPPTGPRGFVMDLEASWVVSDKGQGGKVPLQFHEPGVKSIA